jgi:hypothetical protein
MVSDQAARNGKWCRKDQLRDMGQDSYRLPKAEQKKREQQRCNSSAALRFNSPRALRSIPFFGLRI